MIRENVDSSDKIECPKKVSSFKKWIKPIALLDALIIIIIVGILYFGCFHVFFAV